MRAAFIIEVNGIPLDAEIETPTFLNLEERAKAQAVATAEREAARGARVAVYRVHRRWQRRRWVDDDPVLVYSASGASGH
jgi:hypothetical protein